MQERLSVLTTEKKEKPGGGGMEIMTLLQVRGAPCASCLVRALPTSACPAALLGLQLAHASSLTLGPWCAAQKGGRQRGTWDGKKADGDFYKMIVSGPAPDPVPMHACRIAPSLPLWALASM